MGESKIIAKAQAHLKKHWNYDNFRPDQQRVVSAVLSGKDTLALLPTGGGKSICYQAAGLCFDGIILVVSPLIALMNDQVASLKSKGISAVAIHSGMRYKEVDFTLESAVHNAYKFVYVSPERAATHLFIERFKSMNISLIAIDESHCISQWGFDFRPSYLKLAALREWHPKVPILALTASATQKVQTDICTYLQLRDPQLIIGNFERPNLSYFFIETENKRRKVRQILEKSTGAAIIYTYTRKEAREMAEWLTNNGLPAGVYHGGMTNEQREKSRLSWMQNTPAIMCATNAFGMGIDKPDVRCVIHMSLPLTIEAYYQEAGRAGRDGKTAFAFLIYQPHDIPEAQQRLSREFPEIAIIKRVYLALSNFYQIPIGGGLDTSHSFEIGTFCKRFNFTPIAVFSALKFLEKEGYLALSQSARTPSRVHITCTSKALYNIQLSDPVLRPTIDVLLRSYTGLFDDYVTINEMILAQRLRISRGQVVQHLRQLKDMDAIAYREQSETPWLSFTEEIVTQENLRISPEVYHHQKKLAFERFDAFTHLITQNQTCRNRVILAYFNITETQNCGICDICRKREKTTTLPNYLSIKSRLIQAAAAGKSDAEMIAEFDELDQGKAIEILRYLRDFQLI